MKKYTYLTKHESEALNFLISRLKKALGDCLLQVRFFGSRVRGDYHQNSDIDILVILKERSEKALDQIAEIDLDIELAYDTNFSLIIFSEKEYWQNQQFETPFVQNVQREGIILK